ncbi:MAG: CCA tRNA nucleotidyltransferase, partial [Rhodothermia bacterium]
MSQDLKDKLLHQEVLAAVGAQADDLGVEAYAVGGVVRDSLLDRPTTEIDFVTVGEGSGIALAQALAESQGGRMSHVYRNFGTAGVWMKGPAGLVFLEFVGARKESYRRDSRKPIVEDGSLSDDLRRRDFTVNAMAVEVNFANFGSLHDPFDGLADLDRKLLRTPLEPDATFSDDPLRMVRAARFASQLRFEIDPEAVEAISRNASRIEIVSQERITEEFRQVLCSGSPTVGFKILHTTGILPIAFRELSALAGVETVGGYRHKDNFYHTLQVVDNLIASLHPDKFDLQIDLDDPEEWLRWAALLHDVGKPRTRRFETGTGWTFHGHEDLGSRMIPDIFRRLKFPLDDRMKYVEKLIRLHHRPVSLVDESVTDSAVRRLLFDAGDDIEDLMRLVRADITSKDPRRVRRYLDNFDVVEQKMAEVEEKDSLRNFEPPLDGNEIMQVLGLGEGIAVGIIKENVREAIVDGRIANEHDAAYDFMMEIKDDAIIRADLFTRFVRNLQPREKRVIGTLKELVFYGDLP